MHIPLDQVHFIWNPPLVSLQITQIRYGYSRTKADNASDSPSHLRQND